MTGLEGRIKDVEEFAEILKNVKGSRISGYFGR